MKNLKFSFFTLTICCLLFACKTVNSQQTSLSSSTNKLDVATILSKMTLEDKVGEMTQLSIDVLSEGKPYNLKSPHKLELAKLQKVLVDLKVGSILNVGGYAYTREHWYEIMEVIQDYAMNKKKSGIPVLYGIDAIHGANYTVGATRFPQQIGLAATWNPEHAYETGRITAYETRASAIPWTFSPVLDMGRDPRWPRFWETFGEDVYLASEMGREMVKGYQGDDIADKYRVAACLKHFLGYSFPWSGKDRSPAYIPERQLQEYFVPPFQEAVDNGAATVMINSAEMNGIPVHANPDILTGLLRDQMGFEGLAVSDWEDVGYLYTRHRVAKDFKDAIRIAVNAGLDMAMVPMDTDFPILLKELVEEGKVPMSRIDESVSRILKVKLELGLFDQPYFPMEDYPDFGSAKHAQASYDAAAESITLLKNEKNILPLDKSTKVLITGATANSLRCMNGGWSGTWQGDNPEYDTKGKKTFVQAIQDKVANVDYVEGSSFDKAIDITAAVNAAKSSDVAIVCIGELSYTETPGNIDEFDLPDAQHELVEAIAATGTPIVLVMAAGRPRIVREMVAVSDAFVMTYLVGDEGGRALADILFGDVNPSGKLPFTFPQFHNTFKPYDHKGTDRVKRDFSMNGFEPQFEFGSGLSYTNFKYSDLTLSSKELSKTGQLSISITVKNTGARAGKEVVQLYITDKVASITPPVKRLRGFEKIDLAAGKSKTVTFSVSTEELAFVGKDLDWVTEAGEFEVQIGDLTEGFEVVE